jgi:hypothetical protein
MKRYIFKVFTILLSAILLSSCFDLEHEEFGSISSENFPSSPADLEAAAIGVYKNLGETYIARNLDYAGFTLNELCTDEMNTAWTSSWQIINTLAWAANNNPASDVYSTYIKAVTKSTRLIDAVSKSGMSESEKNGLIAEMRALRVFYANAAYSLFGPIAIITDPAIANDVYSEYKPSRPTKDEYIKFMTDELEEVTSGNDLVNRISAEDWGCFDKGSALTLLMKIYLDAKMFDETSRTADKIINLNSYELLPSYASIFDIANEGSGNREVIFPIGRVVSNTSYAWTYFACVMPQSPAYKTKTGTPLTVWGGLKMPWEFYDKYETQDERLNTIVRYYEDVDGNQVDYRTVQHTRAIGAIPMKYSEDPDHRGDNQGNDFVVFRYADVLLSKAEALNELNGPSSESIELINQVRRRAKATEIKLEDYTKDSLRDFILEERGRELYNEGHRRNDLIRHGKFIQRAIARGIDAQSHHVLYPIPQSAINENPNLKQNPGYEN